jgi:hypothetical protein
MADYIQLVLYLNQLQLDMHTASVNDGRLTLLRSVFPNTGRELLDILVSGRALGPFSNCRGGVSDDVP